MAGTLDGAGTIAPRAFVQKMRVKWIEYGNVCSPALDQVWQQIAETLNGQVEQPSLPRPVIPAELGAGKTTCAKLWCAMLPRQGHPGVLIVVRTVAQAEEYASDINAWAGKGVAFAYHSELKPRPDLDTLRRYSVLVICHRNYELALDNLLVEEPERYEGLMQFDAQQRGLVIIDEALDQVYVASISLEGLQRITSLIDPCVLGQHLRAADVVLEASRALLAAHEGNHVVSTEALLARTGLSVEEADDALVALWRDVRTSNRVPPDNRRAVKEGLTALRRHLAAYRWSESNRRERTLVGSRLLLPPGAGQVILDATGKLNNVYLARPDAYRLVPMTPVRDYRRVTLHLARTKGTGKWAMRKRGPEIIQQALDAVLAHYGDAVKDRRVLVVTNKDSEDALRAVWASAGFRSLDVAHWNRIDGRNDWRDCDTLVIITLPWAKASLDLSTYMAVHGVELDDRDLNAPPDEVREIRETRIAAELAQAIGRIRLRRMTAPDGGCEPCDVFIRFPHSYGVILNTDHVIEGLRRALTDLTVVNWTAVSEPRSRDGRPARVGAKIGDQLLSLTRSMRAGDRVPLTKRKFPSPMFYVVLGDAQREGHPLQVALAGLGAHIVPGGYRPGVVGRVPAELVRTS
jgi:hypothetical protein